MDLVSPRQICYSGNINIILGSALSYEISKEGNIFKVGLWHSIKNPFKIYIFFLIILYQTNCQKVHLFMCILSAEAEINNLPLFTVGIHWWLHLLFYSSFLAYRIFFLVQNWVFYNPNIFFFLTYSNFKLI